MIFKFDERLGDESHMTVECSMSAYEIKIKVKEMNSPQLVLLTELMINMKSMVRLNEADIDVTINL